MSKEKNLVEDALIQMRNLEEAVAENAKGILASTMKQEIKELVKESIVSEQPDDEEIEDDPELSDIPDDEGDDDSEMMDIPDDEDDEDSEMMDMPDDEDDDEDFEMMDMPDDEEDVIDFSGNDDISDEDLLTVFKALGPEDGIIVKKDDNIINLSDEEADQEYMIRMESEDDKYTETYEMYDEYDESLDVDDEFTTMNEDDEEDEFSISNRNFDELVDDIFNSNSSEEMGGEFEEDVVYEIEVDDVEEDLYNEELEETIYEVDLDEVDESDDFEGMQMESMKPKIGKGAKIGKPKFSYKKTSGGFKEDKKQGTRGVGIGKGPKFEFKEGMKQEKKEGAHTMSKGKPSAMFHSGKKQETKEAARTYGMGSKSGRGLRKGITPNRNLTFENEQRNEEQIQILREKNEEYRKALNVFRDKLNEVAIFNSNLAYATRLFTEHSTSKQEKINILRRFDGVESLKESKNLYRTIKSELSNTTTKPSITESIERNIEKSPSSGSASTLIESKTYENPQFLRMKDIMSKIIK